MWDRIKRAFEGRSFWIIWGIGFLGLVMFYLLVTLRIDGYLEELRERDQRLSREISALERQIVRSKAVKEKLLSLEKAIDTLKSFLPKAENMNEIAILLGSSAKNSGFELEKLTFKQEKNKRALFDLKLKGSYFSLINFLDKVWSSPFLIGVKTFNISASSDGSFLSVNLSFAVLER